jgi:hypothetical protein
MSNTLQRQTDLPQTNVTREMIYDLIENLLPTVAMVDNDTLTVLSNQVRIGTPVPRWQKFTVTFAQLAAAATSNSATLFTLPPGGIVHGAKIKHSEEFSGGAISAYTLSVGITGNLTKYTDAFDVFQAPGDAVLAIGDKDMKAETHEGGGTAVLVAAVSTSADLDQADQGAANVWVLWSQAI